MSVTQLEELLVLLGPDIVKQHHIREPISVAERVMLTVRFLASGDSLHSMSYQYFVGVTTAGNIIKETCQAIWDNLMPIVLKVDCSHRFWSEKGEEFFNKWNFPNCVGAIDGKHITIQSPPLSGSSFFNYKGAFSIVLLAICDGNYVFTMVGIGAYGRRSDGGVFNESSMGQKFSDGTINLPPAKTVGDSADKLPDCIVGDEAFPLKPYLMRPYPGKDSDDGDKRVFNYRLSRARRVIENTFGILASRWRIFRRAINLSVENAMVIVQTTVCLQNWLRMQDLQNEVSEYVPPTLIDHEENNQFREGSWRAEGEAFNALQNLPRRRGNQMTKEGAEIREKFCNYFKYEGALDWQEQYM